MDQKDRAYIFSIALVVCLALAPVFAGRFFAAGDTRDIFIPLETFFHEQQIKFSLPSWNPDISWGFPVMASAQIGFFYPPLLLARWLPIWLYLPLNLLAHIFFTALGMYFFLRHLNRSQEAAFLGALSFTLGTFVFQHLTHLNIIFALAWFPWQLIVVQKISERARGWHSGVRPEDEKQRLPLKQLKNEGEVLFEPQGREASAVTGPARSIAILALTLGIPFLAGQIQIPFLIAIVSSTYFLWLTWQRKQKTAKSISIIILAGLLAFGLAAAQLLPTAELAWHSTRGQNNDFNIERANQYSWPLYHLPAVLFPRFFGNDDTYWGKKLELEYGFFIGTIPLLLAIYSFFSLRDSSLRFFKWLAGISFLLALGSLSPFRLIGLEPSLWIFSGPARWLLFTTFSLSLLAAFGWDKIRGSDLRFRKYVIGMGITIIVLAAAANVLLFSIRNSSLENLSRGISARIGGTERFAYTSTYYQEKLTSLLSSAREGSISLLSPYAALPIILLAATPLLLSRRYGIRVLLLATTAELVIIAVTTNPTFFWRSILEPPLTVSELPQQVLEMQARLHSLREFEDTGALLTNPENRSFERLHNEPRRLLLPLIHAQFNLPGVAWPASLDLTEQSETLAQLTEGLKRGETQMAQELNVGAVISNIAPGAPDIVTVKNLDPKPRASLRLQNDTEIPAKYRELSPTHIEIETDSSEPSTLIVRDTYYPGWQATIDGTPASIKKTGIFRSMKIPVGEHVIQMTFKSKSHFLGFIVSLITAASLAVSVSAANRIVNKVYGDEHNGVRDAEHFRPHTVTH